MILTMHIVGPIVLVVFAVTLTCSWKDFVSSRVCKVIIEVTDFFFFSNSPEHAKQTLPLNTQFPCKFPKRNSPFS